MNLSAHFTLEEMTRSQTALRMGIDNTPSPEEIENGKRLCETLLEPARAILCKAAGRDVSIHVDSAFRSRALNRAVGGAETSAHTWFGAADLVPAMPRGISLEVAFDLLRNSNLPYDQIIFECKSWIHLSMAAEGKTTRREALVATGGPGDWHYTKAKGTR